MPEICTADATGKVFFFWMLLGNIPAERPLVSLKKVKIKAIEAITSQPMQLHSRQINKNMQTPGGFKGSKARGQKDSRGKLRPRKKAEGLRVYTLDRRKRRVACHSSREWWVYTLDRIEDNFIRSQETMQESKRLANLIRIELGENLALQYKKMKRTSVPEPAEPKQLKQVRFGSW